MFKEKLWIVVCVLVPCLGFAGGMSVSHTKDLGNKNMVSHGPMLAGDYFTGINVGVGLGFQSIKAKDRVTGTTFSASTDKGDIGFAANFLLGYNYAWSNNWLIGVEGNYTYNTADATASGPNFKSDTEMQNMYGLIAKVGYAADHKYLFFVGAGPAWSNIEQKVLNKTNNVRSNRNKTVGGWQVAAGAEQPITKCFHIREQLTYSDYSNVTLQHSNAVTTKLEGSGASGMIDAVYVF